jgi:thiosulfate/3-mercaptopyruvate sulfurtransferase
MPRYSPRFVQPLVTADWLVSRLADADVVVLDCRYDLADPDASAAAYRRSHIPGAAFLDLERDLSGRPAALPNRRGRHPLPDPDAFTRSARAAGVSASSRIVAYDEAMSGGAARCWWLFRHFGHHGVAVLVDGLAGWGGPLEAGQRVRREGDFTAQERHDDTADDVMITHRDASALVVDARAVERYAGEVEPFDPVAGHIPGAISVPTPETFARVAPLAANEGPVIAYCGSGVTACVTVLALAAAGRDDALLYPGSWSDWVARGLPAATGREPGADPAAAPASRP